MRPGRRPVGPPQASTHCPDTPPNSRRVKAKPKLTFRSPGSADKEQMPGLPRSSPFVLCQTPSSTRCLRSRGPRDPTWAGSWASLCHCDARDCIAAGSPSWNESSRQAFAQALDGCHHSDATQPFPSARGSPLGPFPRQRCLWSGQLLQRGEHLPVPGLCACWSAGPGARDALLLRFCPAGSFYYFTWFKCHFLGEGHLRPAHGR